MRAIVKIVLTAVIIIIWIAINGVIVNTSGRVGIIGLVIAFGAIAAIRGVWKYKPEDEQNETTDNDKLDKTL